MKKTEEFSIGDTVSVTGQENPEHNINFGTVSSTIWFDDLKPELIKKSLNLKKKRNGIITVPDIPGYTGAMYLLEEMPDLIWIPEKYLTLEHTHSVLPIDGLDKALIRGYLIGRLGRPLSQVEQRHVSQGESWHYLVGKFPELEDFMGLMGLTSKPSAADLMWEFLKDSLEFFKESIKFGGLSDKYLSVATNLIKLRDSESEDDLDEHDWLACEKNADFSKEFPLLEKFFWSWGPTTIEKRAWVCLWNLANMAPAFKDLAPAKSLLRHKESELAMAFELKLSASGDNEGLSSVDKIDEGFKQKNIARDELLRLANQMSFL